MIKHTSADNDFDDDDESGNAEVGDAYSSNRDVGTAG
jgi:hypothetical protein